MLDRIGFIDDALWQEDKNTNEKRPLKNSDMKPSRQLICLLEGFWGILSEKCATHLNASDKKGEDKIMKKSMLFIILGIIILLPAYSGAVIIDPSPPINFSFVNVKWDYKDFGNYGTSNYIGGSEMRAGAYFVFECIIVTGGQLVNIEDVIKIEVLNTLTKNSYELHYFPFSNYHYWFLSVAPDDSMFKGIWKFVLRYKGSDGETHRQVKTIAAPEKAFPAKIAYVTLTKSGSAFEVSWSGIGSPGPPNAQIDYRVVVFDAATEDIILDLKGDWAGGTDGTYDPTLNKVTFTIPREYGGDEYYIRLANMIFSNRSLYHMILPAID